MSDDARMSAPSLVPELLVTELSSSLKFWVGLCGFEVVYDRPEEGFAYIRLGSTHFMLDQIGLGRDWAPVALERPFGRGINFEITVLTLDAILTTLATANWPLFLEPETKWYRTANGQVGVRQFLVQDPDGYLLRFTSSLR